MQITAVVPVYNVEKYIDACLESIVYQTIPFYEIILIDDGSKDNSGQKCEAWARKDTRIRVIHQDNAGLSIARNKGIERSKGEYILFVDSDDTIDNDTVEKFTKVINGRKPDLIVGNLRVIKNNDIQSMQHTLKDADCMISGREYLKYEYRHHSMHMASVQCLYRLDFLKENNLTYIPKLIHEDELFTPTVFALADTVLPTDIEFYNHIIREGSITTRKNKEKNAEAIVDICYRLEEWTKTINDLLLKQYILEHCVDLYYKVFVDANLVENQSIRIKRKYIVKNSRTAKNKYRTLVYLASEGLFNYLERKRRHLN